MWKIKKSLEAKAASKAEIVVPGTKGSGGMQWLGVYTLYVHKKKLHAKSFNYLHSYVVRARKI